MNVPRRFSSRRMTILGPTIVAVAIVGFASILALDPPLARSAPSPDYQLEPFEYGGDYYLQIHHYKRSGEAASFIDASLATELPPETAIREVWLYDFGVPGQHHGRSTVKDAADGTLWHTFDTAADGKLTVTNHRAVTVTTEHVPIPESASFTFDRPDYRERLTEVGFQRTPVHTEFRGRQTILFVRERPLSAAEIEHAPLVPYVADLGLVATRLEVSVDEETGTILRQTRFGIGADGRSSMIEDWQLLALRSQ